jgi:hypothetical protein
MIIRLSGLAAIVAAVCLVAGNYIFWQHVPAEEAARADHHATVVITGILWLMGYMALAGAIAGIYSRQYRRAGLIGGTGMVLCVLGSLGIAAFVYRLFPELFDSHAHKVQEAQLALFLHAVAELGAASLVAGLLLFGIGTEVARVFPRFSGLLLVAAAVVAPLAMWNEGYLVLAACLLALGLIWLGIIVLLGKMRPDRQFRREPPQARPASRFWSAQSGDR